MNCVTIDRETEELIVESNKGINLKQWKYKRLELNDNFFMDYKEYQIKVICNEQEYKIPLYHSLIIDEEYLILNGLKHIIIYLF